MLVNCPFHPFFFYDKYFQNSILPVNGKRIILSTTGSRRASGLVLTGLLGSGHHCLFFFFFFFLVTTTAHQIPRPGIQPAPQQHPGHCIQCCMLNPLCHKHTPLLSPSLDMSYRLVNFGNKYLRGTCNVPCSILPVELK